MSAVLATSVFSQIQDFSHAREIINKLYSCLFICWSTAVHAFLARAAEDHTLSWGCCSVFADPMVDDFLWW